MPRLKISVFSCGSQYGDWTERNCMRCAKYDPEKFQPPEDGGCDLDLALGLSYMGDGYVSPEIAERIGYVEGVAFSDAGPAYTWDCPEREPKAGA